MVLLPHVDKPGQDTPTPPPLHPGRSLPPDRPDFVLAEVQEPHLFVVRRQLRAPPVTAMLAASAAGPRAQTQGVYYILGDAAHTYQAPSLHAAVNARMSRCMHFVRTGFGRFKVDVVFRRLFGWWMVGC